MEKRPEVTCNTPLRQAVEEYLSRGMTRAHIPGHKGQPYGLFGDVTRYDVTEVRGTDSLYEAREAIAACEARFARMYGAAHTLLSAGGSTLCIQTMLALAAQRGEKILMGRNCHISAVNAAALLGLTPEWIYPTRPALGGWAAMTGPEDVQKALAQHPDAAAVYLTSPDYFGALADLEAIARLCHRAGMPLLVDNAHGAHLAFLGEGLHPMAQGADLCCDSLHKNMPALTGAALLHLAGEEFFPAAKLRMSWFGSTSPSYLIMLSAEALLGEEDRWRREFPRCAGRVGRLKELAARCGFALQQESCDTVKLTLGIAARGYDAASFGDLLNRYQIEPEYLNDLACVLMFTPFNTEEDYARVERLLREAAGPQRPAPEREVLRPERLLPLREAFFAPGRLVPVEESAGCVAAATISRCPPGMALVGPGEQISPRLALLLKNYGVRQVNVV